MFVVALLDKRVRDGVRWKDCFDRTTTTTIKNTQKSLFFNTVRVL